jgi:hypothetical protein
MLGKIVWRMMRNRYQEGAQLKYELAFNMNCMSSSGPVVYTYILVPKYLDTNKSCKPVLFIFLPASP